MCVIFSYICSGFVLRFHCRNLNVFDAEREAVMPPLCFMSTQVYDADSTSTKRIVVSPADQDAVRM